MTNPWRRFYTICGARGYNEFIGYMKSQMRIQQGGWVDDSHLADIPNVNFQMDFSNKFNIEFGSSFHSRGGSASNSALRLLK